MQDAILRNFPSIEGRYYLGDAGYSLSSYILTLNREVRYHLKEWATGKQKPQTKEELFNLGHASLRNVIERSFGVLKKKFPLLTYMLSYTYTMQVKLVKCAFIIYNFIRLQNGNDPDFLNDNNIKYDDYMDNGGISDIIDDPHLDNVRNIISSTIWENYLSTLSNREHYSDCINDATTMKV